MRPSSAFALLLIGLLGQSEPSRADAFLYSKGVFSTITVPGAQAGSTEAFGINDAGEIVGSFVDANGVSHAFLDNHDVFTVIDAPGIIGTNRGTFARGINDSGQIVGWYGLPSNPQGHPYGGYVYAGGSFTTFLNPNQQATLGNKINNSGGIVVEYLPFGSGLYSNGVFTSITYPGITGITQLFGINDLGQIVGSVSVSGGEFAFLDTNGVFTQISIPGNTGPNSIAVAFDINNVGQVVGEFGDSSSAQGFLDTGGVITIINLPGAQDTTAFGINNQGDIVGSFTPTPEPQPLLLLVAGLSSFAVSSQALKRA